jgi:hypothetical protein
MKLNIFGNDIKLLELNRACLETEQINDVAESIAVANASEMYACGTARPCRANLYGRGHTERVRRQFKDLRF